MIYRKFQGIQLSGLGLGMMRLPVLGGNDGAVDEAAAVCPPIPRPRFRRYWMRYLWIC